MSHTHASSPSITITNQIPYRGYHSNCGAMDEDSVSIAHNQIYASRQTKFQRERITPLYSVLLTKLDNMDCLRFNSSHCQLGSFVIADSGNAGRHNVNHIWLSDTIRHIWSQRRREHGCLHNTTSVLSSFYCLVRITDSVEFHPDYEVFTLLLWTVTERIILLGADLPKYLTKLDIKYHLFILQIKPLYCIITSSCDVVAGLPELQTSDGCIPK